MTYPLIGNYGVNAEDVESRGLFLKGFIVRELCEVPSNYRSDESLDDYLRRNHVVGIQGIDTRSLVRQIRTQGAMKGVISTVDLDDASLLRKVQAAPGLVGRDLVREVMPEKSGEWAATLSELGRPSDFVSGAANTEQPHVVAIDYGMKWNIARYLRDLGCRVTIVPGTATAEEILALNPDGVFLSNGPGDPEPLEYAISTIRDLIGKKPIFGICLGLQLLGLAFGGKTYKLRFGHRGANQPVLNCRTGKVEITSQNHGFAVDIASLPDDIEVTHVNLNDQTVEGIRHRTLPVFGVQYHPEAAAGPHDSHYLFTEFLALMKGAMV
jgi:carbamoyl-phosphate synthase small subunit